MMEDSILQVRMFGKFSIRKGDQEINDNDNRSKKVWLLLAYMIYCRSRSGGTAPAPPAEYGEKQLSKRLLPF